jgi:hypothetical protein
VSRLHFVTELFAHPDFYSVVVLVSLGVVLFAAAYLLSRVNVTVLLIVAIFLQMFSGNWSNMGIPLPLDRVTLAVAISALALKGSRNVSAMRLVLRPLHLAMLSAATWCAVSGIIAGTLTGHLGFYAYLDRFGLVPFIVFCLSPIFFGTPGQRRI